jgi:hypothetical protein
LFKESEKIQKYRNKGKEYKYNRLYSSSPTHHCQPDIKAVLKCKGDLKHNKNIKGKDREGIKKIVWFCKF